MNLRRAPYSKCGLSPRRGIGPLTVVSAWYFHQATMKAMPSPILRRLLESTYHPEPERGVVGWPLPSLAEFTSRFTPSIHPLLGANIKGEEKRARRSLEPGLLALLTCALTTTPTNLQSAITMLQEIIKHQGNSIFST